MVKWLRDIEVSMEGLLALAAKDSTCAKALFNPEEMSKFLDVFEGRALRKIAKCIGDGESHFRNWLLKVGELREEAQKLADI